MYRTPDISEFPCNQWHCAHPLCLFLTASWIERCRMWEICKDLLKSVLSPLLEEKLEWGIKFYNVSLLLILPCICLRFTSPSVFFFLSMCHPSSQILAPILCGKQASKARQGFECSANLAVPLHSLCLPLLNQSDGEKALWGAAERSRGMFVQQQVKPSAKLKWKVLDPFIFSTCFTSLWGVWSVWCSYLWAISCVWVCVKLLLVGNFQLFSCYCTRLFGTNGRKRLRFKFQAASVELICLCLEDIFFHFQPSVVKCDLSLWLYKVNLHPTAKLE